MRGVGNLRTLDGDDSGPLSRRFAAAGRLHLGSFTRRAFRCGRRRVHAHIGDLGRRTAENEGLNATLGFVFMPAGAVLIDSGATHRSARTIDEAVRRVSAVAVRWSSRAEARIIDGRARRKSPRPTGGHAPPGTFPRQAEPRLAPEPARLQFRRLQMLHVGRRQTGESACARRSGSAR